MSSRMSLLLCTAVTVVATAAAGPSVASRLRVEYMSAPLGIDVAYPRFTWTAAHSERGQGQAAYQIVVTKRGHIKQSVVWDSGRVASNASQNVPLGSGAKLAADTGYDWSVRWWDQAGAASATATSTFSTGLYSEADWKDARWIGGEIGQYRKAFAAKGPVARASAYVIGLGYYQLHLNGKQVSTHELGAFTTFEKRVLYDTLDLTETINAGLTQTEQVLGLVLGNGWYNLGGTDPFDGGHPINVGPPTLRVRLSLHYVDGTHATEDIISDPTWLHTSGPVVSAHIYMGTVYNATRETPGWTSAGFDTSVGDWRAAAILPPPSDYVQLSSHLMPQIRTTQTFTPCKMWQSAPGVYVFDMCQNMAGFATLRIPAGVAMKPNVKIEMFHAEAIHGPPENNSGIFNHYTGQNPATGHIDRGHSFELNTYVTRGDGAAIEWSPQFTYAGFRYVQLTGHPGTPDMDTLTAHFIHTDNEDIGSVSFSDTTLNAVQHITRAAARSNFQHVPTDCPQRERRGWLGDAQISAETNLYNFDMAASYSSFVTAISDAQQHDCAFFNRSYCETHGGYGMGGLNGSIPDVVPFYGHGRQQGDPAWGAAYTLIPDWLARWHRDTRVFEQHWAGITAHMDQLILVASKNDAGGLLTFGLYSDWCPPQGCGGFSAGSKIEDPSGLCPPAHTSNSKMVSSFYFILQLRILIKYAALLGHHTDVARYSAVLQPLPAAFNALFFDEANATYREPNKNYGGALSPQTTISLAWQLGVIPEAHKQAVVRTLVDDVASHGYHLNVGIVGAKFLFPTLVEAGRGDIALMVSQQKTAPSYGYMVEQGATTLWETWYSTRYVPGGSPSRPKGSDGVPSWNHIMYGGGTSEFYFKHLAGIQQAPSSLGWEQIVLKPMVWIPARNASICTNLSSASASLVTSRGLVASAWSCATPAPPPPPSPYPLPPTGNSLCPAGSGKLGGNVLEQWDAARVHEIGALNLTCTDGGTMTAIDFASYGWPTGNCSKGFQVGDTCAANGTLAKVAAECVGKSSCTLIAGNQPGDVPGGGPDPCINCYKSLAVIASGCKGTSSFGGQTRPSMPSRSLFTWQVTVPLGATAAVHVPLMGLGNNAHVTEAGAAVWADGKLVSEVSGMFGAEADAGAMAVVFTVGSGAYSFAVLA